MPDNIGLYLHIPFCEKRCAYCDFYSACLTEEMLNTYKTALIREIKKWGGEVKDRPISSVYLGGGTPSLLGSAITEVMDAVKQNFNILPSAEITAEVNPESAAEFLPAAAEAGVNRISIGAQSGNDEMLKTLGRIHNSKDTAAAVGLARKIGFDNINLDIMIALPHEDLTLLKSDLDFILSFSPQHISAYILKVEYGTALYAQNIALPDDDEAAKQYLFMCDYLEKRGYSHYEISNFAREGFESRHNLLYWQTREYIGIGPGAHSFYNNERFYYKKDLKGFIASPETVFEGQGGTRDERLMLGLRLKMGVDINEFFAPVSKSVADKIALYEKGGLIEKNGNKISLTDRGMLVSNSIITELLL